MSILDMATARRTGGTYTTYSAHESLAQFVDHDGASSYTRVIAFRDSDDAMCALYATGAHTVDLIETLNTRNRLMSERSRAVKARDEIAADAETEDADADADLLAEADAEIARFDAEIGALLKVKAEATYHVARTLTAYSADADGSGDE